MADFAAIDTLDNPQLNFTIQRDIKYGTSLTYFLRFQTNGIISFSGSAGITEVLIDTASWGGNGLLIWDLDYSHKFKIYAPDIAGDYTLTLPTLTADDTFTSNNTAQNISNKTLYGIGWRVVSKSADATLADDELVVPVSASGANRTITLPAASGRAGKIYLIQKSDSSANTVTIDPNSTETINGASTFVLTQQYQSVMIWCDGSNWLTQPNSTERTGKAVASGNGSNTAFTIAHGLGSTPSNVFVDCSSHAIARTYTVDSTNISITFSSAPSSGTNNVVIYWRAVA